MMHIFSRAAAVVLFTATVSACAESPAAPQADADPVGAELAAAERSVAQNHPRFLPRLYRHSLKRVARAEGRETAKEVASEIKELLEGAAEARASGDLQGARRLLGEARLRMAGIVVRVYGDGVVGRVLDFVDRRITALNARIDRLEQNGRDVNPRVLVLVETLDALVADAEAAYEAGNAPQALVIGAKAVDLFADRRPR